MAHKPKGLTIGILLGKGKGPGSEGEDEPMDDDESMGEMSNTEDEELPPGLLEAVSEFRAAEDDESAARSLLTAVQLCLED